MTPHTDVNALLLYLIEKSEKIHSKDDYVVPSQPIPGTYNPAKYGRAYYFTEQKI